VDDVSAKIHKTKSLFTRPIKPMNICGFFCDKGIFQTYFFMVSALLISYNYQKWLH